MPSFDPSYGQLDAPLQKQMLALNQANQARMNSNSSYGAVGASSGSLFGGIQGTHDTLSSHTNFQIPTNNQSLSVSNSANGSSFLDPSMSQSANPLANAAHPTSIMERTRNFLASLASFMMKQNTPLPPALTGIPVQNYDPATSMFNDLEPSSEPGSFRLAGKDVDLFKLWAAVYQRGGSANFTNNNMWSSVLSLFDLPESFPSPDGSGMTSVAQSLQHYYNMILGSFEEFYKRNTLEKQRSMQAMKMNGPAALPGTPSRPGPTPMQIPSRMGPPNTPGQPPHPGMNASNPTNGGVPFPSGVQPSPGTPQNAKGMSAADGIIDGTGSEDSQGLKRKLESEELDGKRARQKTESLDTAFPPGPSSERSIVGPSNPGSSSQVTTMNQQPRTRLEPSRRKIEYVPLAREVDSYGGRDMNRLEAAITDLTRQPLRDLSEWGTIDIDSLTMSIRSRISTELSYALTTFTLLSTMKGQQPNTGFPINNCPDLLDEVLDLMEDLAFDGVEDQDVVDNEQDITTNRTLTNAVYESGTRPFAGLEQYQACTDHNLGLRNKSGTVILAVLNIIRNLCVMPDNGKYIAEHPRALDLMLRVCQLSTTSLQSASPSLSLTELITVRKDTLYTLSSVAIFMPLADENYLPPPVINRLTKRIFRLVSSYIIDPVEAVTPMGCVQGVGGVASSKPPSLADIALEVFTKLGQTDANRQVIAKTISQPCLWRFFVSLVHRLPVVDADFQIIIMSKESWISYLDKLIMALYSLAFLSPPKLKIRMKTDRSVGYPSVMQRLVQKLLMHSNAEIRQIFYISARRAIETMKLLDDGADSFDTSKPTVSMLSFGIGYGEVGDTEVERGTGIFGGHRDFGWDILLLREVNHDEQMFSELESLLRVEY
uniref:ARID domain-containing protein n=1 Tax=Moniliophthora roreri TaxID=221103 RepID=A0A0W0G2R4_MONRR